MTDRTISKNFSEKKTISVSSAVLEVSDFDGTNALELFRLPQHSVVTDSRIVTLEAGNSGLTVDLDVGTVKRGDDVAVTTKGTIAELDTAQLLETETTVSLTPSATVTAGQFAVIITYIEFTLGNGTLTNYLPS